MYYTNVRDVYSKIEANKFRRTPKPFCKNPYNLRSFPCLPHLSAKSIFPTRLCTFNSVFIFVCLRSLFARDTRVRLNPPSSFTFFISFNNFFLHLRQPRSLSLTLSFVFPSNSSQMLSQRLILCVLGWYSPIIIVWKPRTRTLKSWK